MTSLFIVEKRGSDIIRSIEISEPGEIVKELHNQIIYNQSVISSQNTLLEIAALNCRELEAGLQQSIVGNLALHVQIGYLLSLIKGNNGIPKYINQ